jgi:hypothetical protein
MAFFRQERGGVVCAMQYAGTALGCRQRIRTHPSMTLRILALTLFGIGSLCAADPNTLTPVENAAGWKLLFDGRTMAGWHIFQKQGEPKGGWHVVDGCLVNPKSNGRPNGSGGDLVTNGKFLNFEFRFEWRISPGGNSGVHYLFDESRPFIAPLYKGDTGHSPVGFEYQVLDDTGPAYEKLGATHKAGALYQLFAIEPKTLRAVGQWNESRIIVNGNHIEHWLNGGKVADCDVGSAAFREAVAKSKYHVIPGFGAKAATALALQDHGEEVAFRGLKIRELQVK